MINKRDMNKLRTPEDLERKYNLKSITSIKEKYELQKAGLNKVENELNNFIIATANNLKELQDQVDGNITTWFYSGVPTEDNNPASDWTTTDEKNNHLGDLYYDKETGYAYRYSLENNVYNWIKITDNDVTKALAIANNAKDVADSKRRVFVNNPIPPYDCGDLWIKDEELYRCQTSKSNGETFEDNDWIIATKYTDDTVANQVGKNLTILSGTVTEIREDVDSLTTTMTNTTKLVDEQGNTIGKLQEKQSETNQTVDKINSSVSSVESKVVKIEQSVPKYQVELDIYNITVPVDSNNKPLENKLYSIGYKTTFEGDEVESNVSSQSSNTGITFGLSNNQITLSVLTSNVISNLSNEFVIDFSYTKNTNTYKISKKVIVTLAIKGNDGVKGAQGEQGPQGEKGDKGDTGAQGLQGAKGDKGDTGAAGTNYWVTNATIDLSDTDIYSEDTWYPVIGTALPRSGFQRFAISVQLNSGTKPSWSTHNSGFSVDLDFETQACGWGTTAGKTLIYADTHNFCSVSPASYQQMTYSSTPVLFLRGGGKYYVKTTYSCKFTPYIETYTWTSGQYSQSVSPQTSRPTMAGTSIEGKDGTSYYVYIRYSANSNGNPMTTNPTSTTKYMGIANTTSSTAPTSYSSYTWTLIKGADGTNGTNGTNGKDGTNGKSSYIHIRYSNDGSTFTGNNGKDVGRYIGSYVDYTETDSTTFSDYSWQDTAIVVEEEIDNLQGQINDTNKDLNNNYTNNQELNQKLEEQKQTITEEYSTLISQTKESWQASVINYINQNGVEKFVNTLVTIDIDGLKLSKSDEDIVSLLNNKGLYVSDGKLLDSLSNLLMKVDRAGALFKLLEVLGTIKEQEIIQKEKIIDDIYGECQAWYWIGE